MLFSHGHIYTQGTLERPGNASYNSDEITVSEPPIAPSKDESCLKSIWKSSAKRPKSREDKTSACKPQERKARGGAKLSSGSKEEYALFQG